MPSRSCLTIVLAAGEGARMRSARPKVLHEIGGRSLLAHVLAAVDGGADGDVAVVVGPSSETVVEEVGNVLPGAQCYPQSERCGTAHAVLATRAAIERGPDDILVVFGDTPLIKPQTLARLRAALDNGAAVAVLGFRPRDPTGYGRLIVADGALIAIREEADASTAERRIDLCNGGVMGLSGSHALAILDRIRNDNRRGEYYLSDAVALACDMGLTAVAVEAEGDEVSGINTKAQLANAEAVLQQRLRQAALDAGVTMSAPETVFLAADTKLGRDVVVEPYVVFGPGVVVEEEAVIHSFSHLVGAHVGKRASVGPFARLRPGTRLGEG
jgi:bifunctional UDP-N-acetylglucosamine pyrophosphorylase/glucosamine-1-phosphate N-acetyltransferase